MGLGLLSGRLDSVDRMPLRHENVGIAVSDLDATIAFFTDLGLVVVGRDTVGGGRAGGVLGLDAGGARIATLETRDGHGRLELFERLRPEALVSKPPRPGGAGARRVSFSVDDMDEALEIAARHGYRPLRGVAIFEDVLKLSGVRGPSGILVMLAEKLTTG